MIKKIGLFAIFPFFLTACNHQPFTSSEKEKNFEHSTPVVENELSSSSSQENGWLPVGQETEVSPENIEPVEVKPLVRHRTIKDDIYTEDYKENPEVVRYDRYLLVDSSPEDGQKYLLEQMVTVKMKGSGLTVEQGMWNTLNGTGYRLCSPIEQSVVSLFGLPLPKVHYKFGPVRLRDAMQMLAGEAYELTLNDALRQLCYVPRGGSVSTRIVPKTVVYATSEP